MLISDVWNVLRSCILYANRFSLFYVATINLVYFIQLVLASFNMEGYLKKLKYFDYKRYERSDNMIPISILVPAHNEEETITDSVKNLLSLHYANFEVIIVNDGSDDGTLGRLLDAFGLALTSQPYKQSLPTMPIRGIYRNVEYPNLIVADKEHGGKADSLNAGVNLSSYPVYAAVDADSLLEKDSLLKIIMPFVEDHSVVATGGIVRIAGDDAAFDGQLTGDVTLPRSPLAKFQVVEYLRAFLNGRMGFDKLKMSLIISGAFGAFNKQLVIDAGGYAVGCIGEDMELVIRLHQLCRERRRKYKVKFIPDPICWTQPPKRIKDLRSQRRRWHVGLVNSLIRNRHMLLNPAYGRIGLVAMPFFWMFEFLGPIIETFGTILIPVSFLLGVASLEFVILFFSLSVLYGMTLSIGALVLEEHSFKKYPTLQNVLVLSLYAFLDNFGFRHLNNVFKLEGCLFYKKNQKNWGRVERRRFEG